MANEMYPALLSACKITRQACYDMWARFLRQSIIVKAWKKGAAAARHALVAGSLQP